MLEGGDVPNFYIAGRTLIGCIYNETFKTMEGIGKIFVEGFKIKLAYFIDDPSLMLEYGVAAILDPRQQQLGKYKLIWDSDDELFPNCRKNWAEHSDFLEEFKSAVVEYAKTLTLDTEAKLFES